VTESARRPIGFAVRHTEPCSATLAASEAWPAAPLRGRRVGEHGGGKRHRRLVAEGQGGEGMPRRGRRHRGATALLSSELSARCQAATRRGPPLLGTGPRSPEIAPQPSVRAAETRNEEGRERSRLSSCLGPPSARRAWAPAGEVVAFTAP
jgi:hypothetical protein